MFVESDHPDMDFCICLLVAFIAHVHAAPKFTAVIDLGSEFMKVAAINPAGDGHPLLEIALNEQSQRSCKASISLLNQAEKPMYWLDLSKMVRCAQVMMRFLFACGLQIAASLVLWSCSASRSTDPSPKVSC